MIFQDFKDGKVDTAFIPKHEEELQAVSALLLRFRIIQNGYRIDVLTKQWIATGFYIHVVLKLD